MYSVNKEKHQYLLYKTFHIYFVSVMVSCLRINYIVNEGYTSKCEEINNFKECWLF